MYLRTGRIRLKSELDDDEIVGIIFRGSYARNEATSFSDVDLAWI